MTVFLMAVAGVCVLLVGAVNYIKAVIRDKKKVSGRQPQWLYILLQVLLTLSYLLPVVLVSAYSVIVIRQPEYFLGKEWFTWSVVGYFLLIAAAVIVGIVLISKKYNNSHSYSSDQAFMYAVYHRAILSFFVCAVAIAGMIYGLTVFGKFQFKNVVSMSDVDQYYEYEYLALDLSEVDDTVNGYTLATSEQCKTLLLRGDNNREYKNFKIITKANKVVLKDMVIQGAGLAVTACEDIVLEIEKNSKILGNLRFEKNAEVLLSGDVEGGVYFGGDTNVTIDGGLLNCNAYFQKKADVKVVEGSSSGSFVFYGDSVIRFGEDGAFSGTVTYGAEASSTAFTFLTYEEEEVSAISESIVASAEEKKNTTAKTMLSVCFEERTDDFAMALKNVGLVLSEGLNYAFDSMLTLSAKGQSGLETLSTSVIDTRHLEIDVAGMLTVTAPQSSNGLNAINANELIVKGDGTLNVTGGNATGQLATGGNAVHAKKLICQGSVKAILTGGNSGKGANGDMGDVGTPGAKGNNESQGKDSVYGYNGRPGGTGGKGEKGGQGITGGAALSLESVPVLSEECMLILNGGCGGTGGDGGTGGKGGRGGDGGDDDRWSFIWIGDMSSGEGGAGGAGGEGGDGGEGGAGGEGLLINGEVSNWSASNVEIVKGDIGSTGNKGPKGSKGDSGSHGDDGVGG